MPTAERNISTGVREVVCKDVEGGADYILLQGGTVCQPQEGELPDATGEHPAAISFLGD